MPSLYGKNHEMSFQGLIREFGENRINKKYPKLLDEKDTVVKSGRRKGFNFGKLPKKIMPPLKGSKAFLSDLDETKYPPYTSEEIQSYLPTLL